MSAPSTATWLLKNFRPGDEALLGDLLENCRNGRSAAWYWRQVVGAILAGMRKDLLDHPFLALRAIATGWFVLLLFFACGDLFAETLGAYAWNWNRWIDGYGSGVWWPFYIAAALVSYAGFALSAFAVAQSYRAHGICDHCSAGLRASACNGTTPAMTGPTAPTGSTTDPTAPFSSGISADISITGVTRQPGTSLNFGDCSTPGWEAVCTHDLAVSFDVVLDEDIPDGIVTIGFHDGAAECGVAFGPRLDFLARKQESISTNIIYSSYQMSEGSDTPKTTISPCTLPATTSQMVVRSGKQRIPDVQRSSVRSPTAIIYRTSSPRTAYRKTSRARRARRGVETDDSEGAENEHEGKRIAALLPDCTEVEKKDGKPSESYRDSPSKSGTTMPHRTVSALSFRYTLLPTDGCAVIGSSGLRSP